MSYVDHDTYKHADLSPLANTVSVNRHTEIAESLRLDLKIATDGYGQLKSLSPYDICTRLQSGRRSKNTLLNNVYDAASAVYCHELYFCNIVTEAYPSPPVGRYEEILKRDFGTLGNFFYLVRTLAAGTSAPGFLWLYRKKSRKGFVLGLSRLPLYTLPDMALLHPLMCIDLWEHAYMDTWGTDSSGYADAYLRQADWAKILGEICPE